MPEHPNRRDPATRAWRDPRLAIGLLLVVASMAGVGALVTAVDGSTPLYVARAALLPGDRIEAGDLAVIGARLGPAREHYLAAGELPAGGAVVTRPVPAGELVPASAVGGAADASLAPVVVDVRGELSRSVVPAAAVDVWATRESSPGMWAAPAVIAARAIVVRIIETSALTGSGAVTSVELLVPRARLASVFDAQANGDAVELVAAATTPAEEDLG